MATHMTLRLAWHNDGWNGCICKQPGDNSYCVGSASYPGDMIREERDLKWEKQHAGEQVSELEKPPACMYGISTFSDQPSVVESVPPEFFNDGTQVKRWTIPAYTACTWPYEAMYNRDDLKDDQGRYDYGKRLQYADEHFAAIEPDKSLVFYYANYSNPFSEDDASRYVLIGVARVKAIGPNTYYDGCSERTLERYKGFVWQRAVTSHYPQQGVRLPYHRYLHQPDILQQFVVYPESSQLCKYASRHVTDDQALGLLEQLLDSVRVLRDDIQDNSENWQQRILWLESLIAELWRSRGAYPGMPAVLDYLGLGEAIDSFRSAVLAGNEQEIVKEISLFCQGSGEGIGDYLPFDEERKKVVRSMQLNAGPHLSFLLEKLSRCALTVEQVEAIMLDERDKWGIQASLDAIAENMFLLSEQYQGESPDDRITWSMMDRALLPSPELGAEPLFEPNDAQRLRALLLETLRGNPQHTFVKASLLLAQVNRRVAVHAEWKREFMTERHLEVDRDFLGEAMYLRTEDDELYLYDRVIWDQERAVQKVIETLLAAPDIVLQRPVTERFWQQVLFSEDSSLAEHARKAYQQAVEDQVELCSAVFNKRITVLTGSAGTGKSTVAISLIRGILKNEGDKAGVAVFAPTGKATDRLRQVLGNDTSLSGVAVATIHSALARGGWLNPNMSFRLRGGKAIDSYSTVIIDECSMVDLELMAALFRAINWQSVKRLVLVGDPAQLPPIGIGKVFADIVSFSRQHYPENLAELKHNLRQLENRTLGKGNGILDLASCYLPVNPAQTADVHESEMRREQLLERIHEGGEVDKDLHVEYWDEADAMISGLINRITEDLSENADPNDNSATIWSKVLRNSVVAFQILCPVRGEAFGTEAINIACQDYKSSYWLQKGAVDGITLFDKVIQVINRPASRPLYGYDFDKKEKVKIEVYNGETGVTQPTGPDWKKFKWKNFFINKFSVKFFGKSNIAVNFGRGGASVEENLELGYAISVHKSQGSEFDKVYLVIPRQQDRALARELVYTALTRAKEKCTLFVQDSVETLIDSMRIEQSALKLINSSLFEFKPARDELLDKGGWYEAGKIHEALTGDMVRSKSEVIIANLLHEAGIDFLYEKPLIAPDGTMHLPDFTIKWRGEEYYWEHLGLLGKKDYAAYWEKKKSWYDKHFPDFLITTEESSTLSRDAKSLLQKVFT